MKTAPPKRVLGTLAAILAFLWLLALPAHAQSFNTTNVLSAQSPTANTIIAGFPTNSPSANGLGQGTGGPISVGNNEFALLCFQAFVCTNIGGGTPTTNNITLQLIRAATPGAPGLSIGTNLYTTNVTSIVASAWETWSNTVPAMSQVVIPIVNTWGPVNWQTNLPQAFVSGADFIGIGAIYVDLTNGMLTNVSVTLRKKIMPIRYP